MAIEQLDNLGKKPEVFEERVELIEEGPGWKRIRHCGLQPVTGKDKELHRMVAEYTLEDFPMKDGLMVSRLVPGSLEDLGVDTDADKKRKAEIEEKAQ